MNFNLLVTRRLTDFQNLLVFCAFLLIKCVQQSVAVEVTNAIELTTPDAIAISANFTKCDELDDMVDNCFKDMPAHLVEFLQASKLAVTEKEISAKCTVFHRGMSCFDEYTSRCLSKEKTKIFENNVYGARKFFRKFCNDLDFQKNYLQHKDCLTYIQDDWEQCTESFKDILVEELHAVDKNVSDRFIQFCCARKAYENCIYNSARYKCYQQSAEFARDTAQMLSEEKYFTNCRQYEQTFCHERMAATKRSGCGVHSTWLQVICLPLLLALFFILRP